MNDKKITVISVNKNYHKIFVFINILFIFVFFSCSTLPEYESDKSFNQNQKPKNSKLRYIINNALYNVDNINIYTNPDEYLNKVISTKGIYHEQKWLKDKDKKFIVSGSNNGYKAEFLVYLDHPLPQKKGFAENIYYISPGAEIRVFGWFVRIEDYMYQDGTMKKLPVLEALAIFKLEDREMKFPVWTNTLFQDIN